MDAQASLFDQIAGAQARMTLNDDWPKQQSSGSLQVVSTSSQMIKLMYDAKMDWWIIKGLFESVPGKLNVILSWLCISNGYANTRGVCRGVMQRVMQRVYARGMPK